MLGAFFWSILYGKGQTAIITFFVSLIIIIIILASINIKARGNGTKQHYQSAQSSSANQSRKAETGWITTYIDIKNDLKKREFQYKVFARPYYQFSYNDIPWQIKDGKKVVEMKWKEEDLHPSYYSPAYFINYDDEEVQGCLVNCFRKVMVENRGEKNADIKLSQEIYEIITQSDVDEFQQFLLKIEPYIKVDNKETTFLFKKEKIQTQIFIFSLKHVILGLKHKLPSERIKAIEKIGLSETY